MTTARQELVAMIESILADWEAGQDWRVGSGQHRQPFDPEDVIVDPADLDARSLLEARSFVIDFLHQMNHGDRNFDGLSWSEAVVLLEEMGARLHGEMPVERMKGLRDVKEPFLSKKFSGDDQIRGFRLLGGAYGFGAVVGVVISRMPQLRGDARDAQMAIGCGILAVVHFTVAEYLRRISKLKNDRR